MRAGGRGSDVVIVCVTGSPQVEEIVYGKDGLLGAARKGLTVVDCSTAEPASTARIRADFAAKGGRWIDAPLARTPKEAEEGRLNTMVGAEPEDFETHPPRARSLLREHLPRRPARPRPCAEADQQHAGHDHGRRHRRGRRRRGQERPLDCRSCSTWCRPAA
jgi:hypothetical protein